MLVEDESVIAMLLEDMLTQFGHTVIGPVGRVSKAVEMAQCETVDVAILDVNLNGQEVYPVAAVLAAREIPFVFATGYGKDSLRAPYDNRPALTKPFQWRDVNAVLAELSQPKETATVTESPARKASKPAARGTSRKGRKTSKIKDAKQRS